MWACARRAPLGVRHVHVSVARWERGSSSRLLDELATGGAAQAIDAKRQAQLAKYGDKLAAQVKAYVMHLTPGTASATSRSSPRKYVRSKRPRMRLSARRARRSWGPRRTWSGATKR